MLLLINDINRPSFKKGKQVVFAFLFFLGISAKAQQSIIAKETLRNELTVGLNTNTNGGLISGFNVRFSYLTEPKKFNLFEFELVNVKHEKEARFSSATGSSFIPGKLSNLIAIRPSFGNEKTIFNRYPENGLRLNFTYSAGPTIGLVKPYMIEYPEYVNGLEVIVIEPYNPYKHNINVIRGDGGFLSGLNMSKLNLGVHARSSLNFEYGPYDYVKLGIETGVTLEAYSKKNILFDNNEARRFYSAFFFHIYYGISF